MDINFPPIGIVDKHNERNRRSECRVRLIWRGKHHVNRKYGKNDLVEFQGALYLCIQDHDQLYGLLHPRNPFFWKPLAEWVQVQIRVNNGRASPDF